MNGCAFFSAILPPSGALTNPCSVKLISLRNFNSALNHFLNDFRRFTAFSGLRRGNFFGDTLVHLSGRQPWLEADGRQILAERFIAAFLRD